MRARGCARFGMDSMKEEPQLIERRECTAKRRDKPKALLNQTFGPCHLDYGFRNVIQRHQTCINREMIVFSTGPFVLGHLSKVSLAHLVRFIDHGTSSVRIQVVIDVHQTLDAKTPWCVAEDIERSRMPRQNVNASPTDYYRVVLARYAPQDLDLFYKKLLI